MDLDVYGLCLGGNVFGWTADRDASFAVLDAYVEAGGNFIDTADTYMRPNMGISETIIGEWMAARGNRDALVIATKVGSDGGLSAANIASHVDGSLARLRTDRIDLYYAHKDDGSVPVEETVRAFDALGAGGQGPARRDVQHDRRAAGGVAGARRARGAGAATSGCSRTTTSSSATGYEREFAPVVERFGLDGRALLRARERLPDRQVPAAATAATARAPRRRRRTSTRAARRVLAALDDGRRRARGAGRGGRDRLAAGQARRRRRRSPAPAPPSSSPPSSRASAWSSRADQITRLDEASA